MGIRYQRIEIYNPALRQALNRNIYLYEPDNWLPLLFSGSQFEVDKVDCGHLRASGHQSDDRITLFDFFECVIDESVTGCESAIRQWNRNAVGRRHRAKRNRIAWLSNACAAGGHSIR